MPRDIVFYSVKEVNQKSIDLLSLFLVRGKEAVKGTWGKKAVKVSFLHGFFSLPISQEMPDCIMSVFVMILSGFFALWGSWESAPVYVIRGRSLQVSPGNK